MTWGTAVVLLVFMFSTWTRLDQLEQTANLIPGKATR